MKIARNNPNLHVHLVNVNAYAKFGQIPSIRSQGIERKQSRNQDMTDNLKTVYPLHSSYKEAIKKVLPKRCPPQSDQSLLSAQRVSTDQSFLHAGTEDCDQTGRMPSPVCPGWLGARHCIGFVVHRLMCTKTAFGRI